ncbi:MAG TPA: serine hydrolase domain-containing protein [Ilumatobacteraceae bacterium]|nr:serine hydrolase domain-containing protein [Ilumatobacteraceae bacterium]
MTDDISGFVAPGWEAVRHAFHHNFTDDEEVGAAVAVYHRGCKVVDIWGGSFDASGERPYDDSTLQLVFSTTKGIVAIAVAMCVERGLLDYDEKVATYWPEFAAQGKGEATVAQLLSHRCGLICPDAPATLADALDWKTITAMLADTKPDWPIGSGHGYHAVTWGWLAGELIRRVDGRSPGQFIVEEIARPLGVEIWIGLPEALEPRVSPIIARRLSEAHPDPGVQAMLATFFGPGTRGGRTLFWNGVFDSGDIFNRRDVRAAEVPAANCVTNARSLAKIYAATISAVDGVRLLSDRVMERGRAATSPDGEPDLCLVVPTTFGMGFMTHGVFSPYSGPGSFGHPGLGGSTAFAHPERGIALGYVMNKMASNLINDSRAQRLTDAAVAAAGAVAA